MIGDHGNFQRPGNFQGPELLAAPGIFQGAWKFSGPGNFQASLENSRILDISKPPGKIQGGSLSPVRQAVWEWVVGTLTTPPPKPFTTVLICHSSRPLTVTKVSPLSSILIVYCVLSSLEGETLGM